jgi:hypothetical protein
VVLVDGVGIAAIVGVAVEAGAAVVVVSIEVDIADAVVVDGRTVVVDASPHNAVVLGTIASLGVPVGVGLDVIVAGVATASCSAAVPHAASITPSSVTSTRPPPRFIVVTVATGDIGEAERLDLDRHQTISGTTTRTHGFDQHTASGHTATQAAATNRADAASDKLSACSKWQDRPPSRHSRFMPGEQRR